MSALTHNKFRQQPYTKTFTVTLVGDNNTFSLPIATFTGAVAGKVYGIVTTNLSSNITAAHLRLNDGTNTPAVTLATGTTLSSYTAGSVIAKTGQVDVAITGILNDQARVVESAVDNLPVLQEFLVSAKTGATTTLDFRYTCNNQSSGVIQFTIIYVPLGSGSVS